MSGHISKLLKEQMEMVNLTINNIPLTVPKGTKIMQAAQEIGIDIPHLCYHEDQSIKAHCRLCSVEVTGRRRLLRSASDGRMAMVSAEMSAVLQMTEPMALP